jgi:hypothetical protein
MRPMFLVKKLSWHVQRLTVGFSFSRDIPFYVVLGQLETRCITSQDGETELRTPRWTGSPATVCPPRIIKINDTD